MILLKLLEDKEVILKLLNKDRLYRYICPEKEINTLHNYWYAIVETDLVQVIGLFILTPHIGNTVYFHGGLYKKYRGKNTNSILRTCMEQAAPQKDVIFMAPIAAKNKMAIRAAENFGLEYKTTIKGGLKNDDLLIYSEV